VLAKVDKRMGCKKLLQVKRKGRRSRKGGAGRGYFVWARRREEVENEYALVKTARDPDL